MSPLLQTKLRSHQRAITNFYFCLSMILMCKPSPRLRIGLRRILPFFTFVHLIGLQKKRNFQESHCFRLLNLRTKAVGIEKVKASTYISWPGYGETSTARPSCTPLRHTVSSLIRKAWSSSASHLNHIPRIEKAERQSVYQLRWSSIEIDHDNNVHVLSICTSPSSAMGRM